MKKKVRVAMAAANLELNGISSVIMNYCRNIDKDKFDITIFAGNQINQIFKKECEKLNINIIELYCKRKSKLRYYFDLFRKVHKNEFDIFHVHGNSAVMAFDLMIALIKGVKIRIAHSHNTICDNPRIHKLLNPIFQRLYTHAFACGEKAGEWIFKNKKFEIISNGIDINKYSFDESMRNNVRKELGIKDNEMLIGHIRENKLSKKSDILIGYV